MGQPDEDLAVNEDFTPEDHIAPEERDPEAPSADVIEQATPLEPTDDDPVVQRGLEVDEWDAMEQARVVGPDDEDYR